MTVDSVLTRAETYRALYKNSNRYSLTNKDLLIGEDWDGLYKSMLQNINFFNKSEYIPVTVDEINTIRKIYELDFNYITFLCDFFRGVDIENVNACLIDGLCDEMKKERDARENASISMATDEWFIASDTSRVMADALASEMHCERIRL